MCGIAGLIVSQPDRGLALRAARMAQAMFHRGPDDGGVVVFGQVSGVAAARLGGPSEPLEMPSVPAHAALASRRLAILDLSQRGHQPMASHDRLGWIVHNGEIYNYIELRETLAADGWVFQTGTDTEVALAAWRAWGPACFKRFDGMWAMAVYEPDSRRLVLSRDRFGIKPLYYVHRHDCFAFASEIKALLTLPDFARRVNTPRLVDFLTDGWIDHTDQTLFEGVRQLPGGCHMSVTQDEAGEIRTAIHRDFEPGRCEELENPRLRLRAKHERDSTIETQTANEVRGRIETAVRMQLRSDVPVGSCLSGGIDSSAIVMTLCAMREPGNAWTQHTFTAVLPGDPLDESRYADMVLAACPGLHRHRVAPTAEGLLENLDSLLWHQEEPFGSPSIYLQWEVMKLARDASVRVLLDGQGGDELFCGYPGYFPQYIAQLVREFRWGEAVRIARSPFVRQHFGRGSLAGRVLAHLVPADAREAFRETIRGERIPISAELLIEAERDPARQSASSLSTHVGDSAFDAYWWDILLHKSLPSLLHFEDRNSMAFSIEARVPLLGDQVSDLAIALPAEMKLRDGVSKSILRDAMRGRVPDVILDRTDKIGFAAPTLRWMQGPLRDWWRNALASGACRERGWMNPSKTEPLARRLDQDDAKAALVLWRLAISELWAQRMLTT